MGDRPHFLVEGTRHPVREFAILVGPTASGRKGTSAQHVLNLLGAVDEPWKKDCVLKGGLSTGEGLIARVRDEIWKEEPIRQKGRVTGYQRVKADSGVRDKRLFIIEPELARTIRAAGRKDSTLSPIIRQAWDDGDLAVATRSNPLKATGAHISIVGHVTQDELSRTLSATDVFSGFVNRFLIAAVRRTKELPHGGNLSQVDFAGEVRRLRESVEFARTVERITMDDGARAEWERFYPALTRDRPGMFGAATQRGAPHVLRLAAIYALLDRSATIGVQHLWAALAVWNYCENSARLLFGTSSGDPDLDALQDELRSQGKGGMTRKEIRDFFNRHKSRREVDALLSRLLEQGAVQVERERTAGRDRERWRSRGA
jgi:hypothetical protein